MFAQNKRKKKTNLSNAQQQLIRGGAPKDVPAPAISVRIYSVDIIRLFVGWLYSAGFLWCYFYLFIIISEATPPRATSQGAKNVTPKKTGADPDNNQKRES